MSGVKKTVFELIKDTSKGGAKDKKINVSVRSDIVDNIKLISDNSSLDQKTIIHNALVAYGLDNEVKIKKDLGLDSIDSNKAN